MKVIYSRKPHQQLLLPTATVQQIGRKKGRKGERMKERSKMKILTRVVVIRLLRN